MILKHYLSARILQADLVAVDAHFSEYGISDMKAVICVKNALIALANLVDFERSIRGHYAEHRELSAGFTAYQKQYEFSKYLRNKFVGHIHSDLIEKAVEWNPRLRYIAARMDESQIMLLANLFLIETAINTYVDQDGKHRIFESETDLMYPPDWMRFLDFLEKTVRSAIQYLAELCATLNNNLDHPDPSHFDVQLWIKAGETKFSFLKK